MSQWHFFLNHAFTNCDFRPISGFVKSFQWIITRFLIKQKRKYNWNTKKTSKEKKENICFSCVCACVCGSSKKQESSRKTSISALLTMPKPLTVWITINWKILKEMGIPDNLTCLLRNLYAGQEAIVRTGHGTTDWFQIGKGVWQGCILSPCLFNLYAEYIMRNAGLEEAQMTPPLWQKVKMN